MLKWEWKMSKALVCIKYLIFSQWEVSGKGPYNKYYERQFHHWTRLLMTSFALTETLQMQPLRFCGPIKQATFQLESKFLFLQRGGVGWSYDCLLLSLSPPALQIWSIQKEFCVAWKVFVVAAWFWQRDWRLYPVTCNTWTQEDAPFP